MPTPSETALFRPDARTFRLARRDTKHERFTRMHVRRRRGHDEMRHECDAFGRAQLTGEDEVPSAACKNRDELSDTRIPLSEDGRARHLRPSSSRIFTLPGAPLVWCGLLVCSYIERHARVLASRSSTSE
jgi:hypothetical protein